MALLSEPSEIGQMIVDKLQVDLVPVGFQAEDVYYGDRDPVNFPAVTVEVVDKQIRVRNLGRTELQFAAYLLVYYGRYDPAETARKQSDQKAEQVVDVMNSDYQWRDGSGNQRLIKAWCTRLEPGYATRNRSVLYVSRITWEAMSMAPL